MSTVSTSSPSLTQTRSAYTRADIVALLVLAVALTAKLSLARAWMFDSGGLWQSLRLEAVPATALTALCYLCMPTERARRAFASIAYVVLSMLIAAVVVYMSMFERVPSPTQLVLVRQLGDVGGSVLSLLKLRYLLLVADVPIVIAAVRLSGRWTPGSVTRSRATSVVAAVLVAALVGGAGWMVTRTALYARGSSARQAFEAGLLNYEAASLVRSAFRSETAEATDPENINERLDALMSRTPHQPGEVPPGAARGKNLVLIQVESMQSLVVGLKVDGREVTPNLNRLVERSLYYPRTYTQIGMGNTSDAEFAVNTGLYPMADVAVSTRLEGVELPSLPRKLAARGYSTITLHPNDLTFWSRDKLYPALGFQTVRSKAFFENEDVVGMGSSDDVLFAKAAEDIRRATSDGKPVYAHLITLTTHHPFKLPEEKLPGGRVFGRSVGGLVGDYLDAMRYEDAAIGDFIAQLEEDGLTDDTVVVVYGDHFGLQPSTLSESERASLQRVLGREYTTVDMLTVPFIVRVPGVPASTADKPVSQVDFLPTFADLFGFELTDPYFGQDVLRSRHSLFSGRYYLSDGSYVDDEICAVASAEGGWTAYSSRSARPVSAQVSEAKADAVRKIMELSDAYLASRGVKSR